MPQRARNSHLLDQVKLGDEIEVWWPDDAQYYSGTINSRLSSGRHRILYNDGEVEDLRLATEQWRFIGKAAERILAAASKPSPLDVDSQDDIPLASPPDLNPPTFDSPTNNPAPSNPPTNDPPANDPPAKASQVAQPASVGKRELAKKKGKTKGRKSDVSKPSAPKTAQAKKPQSRETVDAIDTAKAGPSTVAPQPAKSTTGKLKKRRRTSAAAENTDHAKSTKTAPAKQDSPAVDADAGLIDAAPLLTASSQPVPVLPKSSIAPISPGTDPPGKAVKAVNALTKKPSKKTEGPTPAAPVTADAPAPATKTLISKAPATPGEGPNPGAPETCSLSLPLVDNPSSNAVGSKGSSPVEKKGIQKPTSLPISETNVTGPDAAKAPTSRCQPMPDLGRGENTIPAPTTSMPKKGEMLKRVEEAVEVPRQEPSQPQRPQPSVPLTLTLRHANEASNLSKTTPLKESPSANGGAATKSASRKTSAKLTVDGKTSHPVSQNIQDRSIVTDVDEDMTVDRGTALDVANSGDQHTHSEKQNIALDSQPKSSCEKVRTEKRGAADAAIASTGRSQQEMPVHQANLAEEKQEILGGQSISRLSGTDGHGPILGGTDSSKNGITGTSRRKFHAKPDVKSTSRSKDAGSSKLQPIMKPISKPTKHISQKKTAPSLSLRAMRTDSIATKPNVAPLDGSDIVADVHVPRKGKFGNVSPTLRAPFKPVSQLSNSYGLNKPRSPGGVQGSNGSTRPTNFFLQKAVAGSTSDRNDPRSQEKGKRSESKLRHFQPTRRKSDIRRQDVCSPEKKLRFPTSDRNIGCGDISPHGPKPNEPTKLGLTPNSALSSFEKEVGCDARMTPTVAISDTEVKKKVMQPPPPHPGQSLSGRLATSKDTRVPDDLVELRERKNQIQGPNPIALDKNNLRVPKASTDQPEQSHIRTTRREHGDFPESLNSSQLVKSGANIETKLPETRSLKRKVSEELKSGKRRKTDVTVAHDIRPVLTDPASGECKKGSSESRAKVVSPRLQEETKIREAGESSSVEQSTQTKTDIFREGVPTQEKPRSQPFCRAVKGGKTTSSTVGEARDSIITKRGLSCPPRQQNTSHNPSDSGENKDILMEAEVQSPCDTQSFPGREAAVKPSNKAKALEHAPAVVRTNLTAAQNVVMKSAEYPVSRDDQSIGNSKEVDLTAASFPPPNKTSEETIKHARTTESVHAPKEGQQVGLGGQNGKEVSQPPTDTAEPISLRRLQPSSGEGCGTNTREERPTSNIPSSNGLPRTMQSAEVDRTGNHNPSPWKGAHFSNNSTAVLPLDTLVRTITETSKKTLQSRLVPLSSRFEKFFADNDRLLRSLQGKVDKTSTTMESLQMNLGEIRKAVSETPSTANIQTLMGDHTAKAKREMTDEMRFLISEMKEDLRGFLQTKLEGAVAKVAAEIQRDSVMLISRAIDNAMNSGLLQEPSNIFGDSEGKRPSPCDTGVLHRIPGHATDGTVRVNPNAITTNDSLTNPSRSQDPVSDIKSMGPVASTSACEADVGAQLRIDETEHNSINLSAKLIQRHSKERGEEGAHLTSNSLAKEKRSKAQQPPGIFVAKSVTCVGNNGPRPVNAGCDNGTSKGVEGEKPVAGDGLKPQKAKDSGVQSKENGMSLSTPSKAVVQGEASQQQTAAAGKRAVTPREVEELGDSRNSAIKVVNGEGTNRDGKGRDLTTADPSSSCAPTGVPSRHESEKLRKLVSHRKIETASISGKKRQQSSIPIDYLCHVSDEEYKRLTNDGRVLLAMCAVEWFLKGGCRDAAPSTERNIPVTNEWVKQCIQKCLSSLVANLEDASSYREIATKLERNLGSHVQIDWLLQGPTLANISRARVNYADWEPQLFDFEWQSEKRVLAALSRNLYLAEKSLLESREICKSPLDMAKRCVQRASEL